MIQPYIDCAIALRRGGIAPHAVESVRCETAEGIVHRLWEPLTEKRRPTTPYSAKFSVPYCVALGLIQGTAGLADFTPERIADPEILGLAARVGYVVDPHNEYPRNYTGHVEVRLRDGKVHEARQAHMRGGVREPLSHEELARKFRDNVVFGGGSEARVQTLRGLLETLFERDAVSDLGACRALS